MHNMHSLATLIGYKSLALNFTFTNVTVGEI